jgi:chromate transport protein ChrA
MAGLRAVALGMVVVALIQLMPAAIKNKWAMLAAVVAFVLIAVLKVNTAYVILLFAVLGITVTFAGSRKMAAAAEGSGGAENVNTGAEGNDAGEGGESE